MPEAADRPPPSIDPTVLTTEALNREIAAMKISIDQWRESHLALQATEQAAVHDRFDLEAAALTRRLSSIENEMSSRLGTLQELVDKEFELVERQRVEQKKDTKDAVDAALTAQKEAVREQTVASSLATTKSETATLKQIEQLSLSFTTAVEALRRSIDEVKERIGEVDRNLRDAATLSDQKTASAISELRSRLDQGPPELRVLRSRADEDQGRRVGALDSRTLIFALVGSIAAIVGIAAAVLAATGH